MQTISFGPHAWTSAWQRWCFIAGFFSAPSRFDAAMNRRMHNQSSRLLQVEHLSYAVHSRSATYIHTYRGGGTTGVKGTFALIPLIAARGKTDVATYEFYHLWGTHCAICYTDATVSPRYLHIPIGGKSSFRGATTVE